MFILPGSFKWCIYGNNGTFLSFLGVLIVNNIPCWDFPNPIKECLLKIHSLKGHTAAYTQCTHSTHTAYTQQCTHSVHCCVYAVCVLCVPCVYAAVCTLCVYAAVCTLCVHKHG